MSARSGFVMDAALVIINLLCIAFLDGGLWNAIAAVILTIPAVTEFRTWRAQAARDRRWTP